MFDFITFHGRADRLAYLVGIVAPALLTVAISTLGSIAEVVWRIKGLAWGILGWVVAAVMVATLLWSWMAATVKRIRDIGLPVWPSIIGFQALGFAQPPLLKLTTYGFRHGHLLAAAPWVIVVLATAVAWSVLFLWPGKDRPLPHAVIDEVFGGDAAEPAFGFPDTVLPRAQFGLRQQRVA